VQIFTHVHWFVLGWNLPHAIGCFSFNVSVGVPLALVCDLILSVRRLECFHWRRLCCWGFKNLEGMSCSDDNGSAIFEVAISHNECRSSYISSQKVTINNFKGVKEHECIDFTANFLIDIFLTLLFLIMLSKISRKVTKFFFPVKSGTAILNYQVRCHMLNHLIFMFWWRYAHICVLYFKIEAWLNNLVRNLLGLIFSIKTSYLAEIGQLWHYFHESGHDFEVFRW